MDNSLIIELKKVFSKYNEVEKVMLFGSRARGDFKSNSDVDICLFGKNITHLILSKISMDIDELNTPLSFDLLNFDELNKEELIKNILSEGVVIYNGKKAQ
ncbi:MAG: nucleotidyltransferase family protein [Clostridiaceae bacterium]